MMHEHEREPFVLYKNITAFVGHSFNQEDHDLVSAIKHLLTSLGVTCDSGEKPQGRSVSKKILERIKSNELFVGIFTRKTKLSGTNQWTTSSWIVEEKAAAINERKRLLLLVEEGVTDIGGLQGDYEYVRFNKFRLYEALPRIIDYIRSFTIPKQRVDVTLLYSEQEASLDSLLQQIKKESYSADTYIKIARKYGKSRNLDGSEEILRKGLKDFPDSTDIRYELANVLRFKKQFLKSKKLFESLLAVQPKNPKFHHNFAHLLEDMGDFDKALEHFQIALDINPSSSSNFGCYGKCLYRKAMSLDNKIAKKETLKKAKRLIESGRKLGDEKVDKQLKGFILRIDGCLRE